MSNIIQLRLEVYKYHGTQVATYSKNIESDFTPNKDMVVTGVDYTLKPHTVFFDANNGNIIVRMVEYLAKDDATDLWDFLLKQDWRKS